MPFNTATAGAAVTPAVIQTFLSHYLNRKPLAAKPTAHISYHEGITLIKRFLVYASQHTVEDLQRFTAQWVPHPHWVKKEEIAIAEEHISRAAGLLQEQLGHHGIERVGGKTWWQWRRPGSELKAEWIEMRSDYDARKKSGDPGKRVMLYVHGGAYFFGSVDEHRYQLQRHARKLNARVFAPRYRLAPQFPFPCGLHDCLAAYLHLLTVQDPTTIILAGDSAGGGMILGILCLLRDHGLPLPAGAILISPWVDLTHSFPSITADNPLDYIPPQGFHHMPSAAWPPPNADDMLAIEEGIVKDMIHKQHLSKEQEEAAILGFHLKDQLAGPDSKCPLGKATANQNLTLVDSAPLPGHKISLMIDDKIVEIADQIQMYTTNQLLAHPLVSPVLQPSLGGLPPLLIMVGGGEILRDEQIYLAHKAANPEKYIPADVFLDDCAHDHNRNQIKRWKPTDVQLQVWEDLCHVAPVLSFTRPAKYMYRSIAQFGAWALARAQQTEIEIMDDDNVSVISNSDSETEDQSDDKVNALVTEEVTEGDIAASPAAAKAKAEQIGKAGDPLPAFKRHMIRQRVDRHGIVFPLDPASDLSACNVPREHIGIVKEGPMRKWMAAKLEWDTKFASQKRKVQKQRAKEMAEGYLVFGNEEVPPPSALAGRRLKGSELREEKKTKSYGLSLWSGWGSKHDEKTLEREEIADTEPEASLASPFDGAGARPVEGAERTPSETLEPPRVSSQSRSRSHRRIIVDEHQTDHTSDDEDAPVAAVDENTTAAELLALKPEVTDPQLLPAFATSQASEQVSSSQPATEPHLEIPDGTTKAKRPKADGIAFPFSLKTKEDRPQSMSSMMTLTSSMSVPPATELGVEEAEGKVESGKGGDIQGLKQTDPTVEGKVKQSA